jgi:tRNA(Ile)-lysidine synthase
VAFSGGSDSLATLVAAKRWGDRVGREVWALTVDHGLNPQSASWTAQAQQTAQALGVRWIGLNWTGDKPSTGLPAAARQARHRLLAQAAREIGARVILFGHTADDRQESELIRTETPGLGYLREWSPSPDWPDGRDLFVLRPLLHARRDDLRAWLTNLGLGWLDDPANADLRYARSRARATLAAGGGGRVALDDVPLGETDDADLVALAAGVSATYDGRLIVSRETLRQASLTPSAQRRLVGSAVLCASGGVIPPRGPALDRLVARLRGGEAVTATLCGARIVANDETVVFAREAGEGRRGGVVGSPMRLSVGEAAVFDGRFKLMASVDGLSAVLLAGRLSQLSAADAQAVRRLPAYARGALPILLDADGAVSLPAPFGSGAVQAESLVGCRLAQACGAVRTEAEIDGTLEHMAPGLAAPYVGR